MGDGGCGMQRVQHDMICMGGVYEGSARPQTRGREGTDGPTPASQPASQAATRAGGTTAQRLSHTGGRLARRAAYAARATGQGAAPSRKEEDGQDRKTCVCLLWSSHKGHKGHRGRPAPRPPESNEPRDPAKHTPLRQLCLAVSCRACRVRATRAFCHADMLSSALRRDTRARNSVWCLLALLCCLCGPVPCAVYVKKSKSDLLGVSSCLFVVRDIHSFPV